MSIECKCPQCGKLYSIAEEKLGKTGKCKCGRQFLVEALAAHVAPARPRRERSPITPPSQPTTPQTVAPEGPPVARETPVPPPAAPPAATPQRSWRELVARHWSAGAALAVVLAYAVFQFCYFTPGCPESDTGTYMALAERILHGGPVGRRENDLLLYQAHSWVQNPSGEVVPKYTPGNSAVLAIGMLIGGPTGAYTMNPLLGALAVLGAYLLFRFWLGKPAALLATFALASLPMFVFFTNYPLAHAADVCCVVWGMYFLWKWDRQHVPSSAIAAGLILGYSQLVRPQDVLLCLPIIAAAVLFARERRWSLGALKQVGALLGTYAIFPIVHMIYNARVYGGPFTTGYALSAEQTAFTLSDLVRNLPYMFDVLGGLGLSVYFGLGILGLLTVPKKRDAILLAAWVIPMVVLCLSYYWAPRVNQGGYGRFFLPVFPALVGSSFGLMERLPLRPKQVLATMIVVCALVFGARLPLMLQNARMSGRNDAGLQQQVADLARHHLADGATVFAEPLASLYISDRYRVYDTDAFRADQGRRLFTSYGDSAVKYQPLRERRLRAFYAADGNRLPELMRDRVGRALQEGRQAAFLIRGKEEGKWQGVLGPSLAWTAIDDLRTERGDEWRLYEIKSAPPGATSQGAAMRPAPKVQGGRDRGVATDRH